ncbi:MAG: cytochrome c biogenesis protein CcsA [Actinobacteria bacterium]|nr:cytochrome c biogenesis protein CcsA [Actinomycetota bacterium]
MIELEILLLWAAVAIYALSTVLYVYSVAFQKDKFKLATIAAWLALVFHSASLALRWIEAGHGPYMRRFEVYSSDVWIAVILFLLAQTWKKSLRFAGAIVMPASFLLIGMAVLSSPEITPLPSTFKTYWLIVHIIFAKLAFGGAIIGTAMALFYVLKKRKMEQGVAGPFYSKLPSLEILDELSYGFIGFGFLNLGVMIIAGSIWAKTAWGSYWSWDPVEVWSLIAWFVYAIYFHLRRTYGWKGTRLAWVALGGLAVLVFSLFGLGIFYSTGHSPYLG